MTQLDAHRTLRELMRQNDRLKKKVDASERRDRIYQRQLRVLLSALGVLAHDDHWGVEGSVEDNPLLTWRGPGEVPAKIAMDAIDDANKVDMT